MTLMEKKSQILLVLVFNSKEQLRRIIIAPARHSPSLPSAANGFSSFVQKYRVSHESICILMHNSSAYLPICFQLMLGFLTLHPPVPGDRLSRVVEGPSHHSSRSTAHPLSPSPIANDGTALDQNVFVELSFLYESKRPACPDLSFPRFYMDL